MMIEYLRLFMSLFNLVSIAILGYKLYKENQRYACLYDLHIQLIDDYRRQSIIFSEKRIPTKEDKVDLWRVWIYNYTMDAKLRLFVQMSLDSTNPKWVEFKMLRDNNE